MNIGLGFLSFLMLAYLTLVGSSHASPRMLGVRYGR